MYILVIQPTVVVALLSLPIVVVALLVIVALLSLPIFIVAAATGFAQQLTNPGIENKQNKKEEATIDTVFGTATGTATGPIATAFAQLLANPEEATVYFNTPTTGDFTIANISLPVKEESAVSCFATTFAHLPLLVNPDKRKKKTKKKRWNNNKKKKNKKKAEAATAIVTTATAESTDLSLPVIHNKAEEGTVTTVGTRESTDCSPAVIQDKAEEATVSTIETPATAESTDLSLAVTHNKAEEGTVTTVETRESTDCSPAVIQDKAEEATATSIETTESTSTSLTVFQDKHHEAAVTTIATTESTDTSIVLASSDNIKLANFANAADEVKNLGEGDEMAAVEATVTTVALPPSADMQTKPKVVDSDPSPLAGAQLVTSSKSLEELVAAGDKAWAEMKLICLFY
mmetsp:Transcript_6338/g.14962  ORF Transcript_6338/g.14962 Transcript_6338/m.14962 type:complete len:403 (+) Transcript_6338:464-1672(+)